MLGPDCSLLPPRSTPAALYGLELVGMRAVLEQEKAALVPRAFSAKNYYRMMLASGRIAGSTPVSSDCGKHPRGNFLLWINVTEQVRCRDGSVEERLLSTFGAVLHYASVYMDGQALAFTYVERVKSAKTRLGRFSYASTKYGLECILGLGGARCYVPTGALTEVLATLEREASHFVLHNREPVTDALGDRRALW